MSEPTAKHKMPHLICPNCDYDLFPMDEAKEFPDSTYTETCPNCWKEYSYRVKDGEVSLWEPPQNVRQEYKGKGKPGGKNG